MVPAVDAETRAARHFRQRSAQEKREAHDDEVDGVVTLDIHARQVVQHRRQPASFMTSSTTANSEPNSSYAATYSTVTGKYASNCGKGDITYMTQSN